MTTGAYRRILSYDPDQIVTLYATPHRWTPFFREVKDRRIIQADQRRWDYKQQVIENPRIPPWLTFAAIKLLEAAVQSRPKALRRTYLNRDPAQRHGMRWYARMGRRVWLHEIWAFIFRDRRLQHGPTVAEHWGAPRDDEEEAMARPRPARTRMTATDPPR